MGVCDLLLISTLFNLYKYIRPYFLDYLKNDFFYLSRPANRGKHDFPKQFSDQINIRKSIYVFSQIHWCIRLCPVTPTDIVIIMLHFVTLQIAQPAHFHVVVWSGFSSHCSWPNKKFVFLIQVSYWSSQSRKMIWLPNSHAVITDLVSLYYDNHSSVVVYSFKSPLGIL